MLSNKWESMKITSVDAHHVIIPAANPPFRWRDGLPGSSRTDEIGAVLAITTEDGIVGYAFDPHGAIVVDIVERRLREELIGRDVRMRELLWHRVWEIDRLEALPIYARGLVDIAAWDIAGKSAGIPAHELMGTFRSQIPAYASTTTFDTTEEFLDVADQCVEAGFSAIKLHAWGDAVRDARLCEALREHVGPEIDLMYDGSAAFDLPDAVYLGRALSAAGYRWYEEPMREASVSAYRLLSKRVDVPLLVAETSHGAHLNTADFVASGSATYVRTSTRYKSGFTGALRVAHLADSFDIRAEVHGAGPESQHLCMAIPNTTYYESFVSANPMFKEDIVTSSGMVLAPTEPGVGLPSFVADQLPRYSLV